MAETKTKPTGASVDAYLAIPSSEVVIHDSGFLKEELSLALSFLFRQEFLEGFIIANTSTEVVLTHNCFVDALLYLITLFFK